jgi:choline dehydrogenase
MIYWLPAYFSGFFHGFSEQIAKTHNVITAVALKVHSSFRGVVRLTGNHPQESDPVHIEKRHFEAPSGQQDIVALREAIKVAQSMVERPNITVHVDAQVFPATEVKTDEEFEDHILEYVFGMLRELAGTGELSSTTYTGHHACCTNPMGPDDGLFCDSTASLKF